jgi:hypothetical protein
MSLKSFVDGTRISFSSTKRSLAREAGDFAQQVRLNTGKAESQWLGALLLMLAAYGGTWQAVPWRLIRNTYMHYDWLKRLQLRQEKCLPPIPAYEPVVVYESGGGTPIDELYNGIRHLLECGLVEIITQEKEDFLFPTNALLNCAPKVFDMMTASL